MDGEPLAAAQPARLQSRGGRLARGQDLLVAPDPIAEGETGGRAPRPAARRQEPADPAGGLRLQVDVVEESWVRVVIDEQTRFDGRVRPGQPKRFRAGSRIVVSTRNASAVVLTLNGETLPPLGQPGEEKTVVLTAQDLKPANP